MPFNNMDDLDELDQFELYQAILDEIELINSHLIECDNYYRRRDLLKNKRICETMLEILDEENDSVQH